MSLLQIRKDIDFLKHSAASQIKKRSEYDPSHLTDEELLNEINKELAKLGLKTQFTMNDKIPFDFLEKLELGNVE